jgi:hypothetical protein
MAMVFSWIRNWYPSGGSGIIVYRQLTCVNTIVLQFTLLLDYLVSLELQNFTLRKTSKQSAGEWLYLFPGSFKLSTTQNFELADDDELERP